MKLLCLHPAGGEGEKNFYLNAPRQALGRRFKEGFRIFKPSRFELCGYGWVDGWMLVEQGSSS